MSMTTAWHECDGPGLKRLAAAGLAWLDHKHEEVNSLNVFPVPDGDTGINMLLTMRSAWNEIANADNEDVSTIAAGLSKGAVMGSRGNSGVILSQLWLGFSQSLEGKTTFDASEFAQGMRSASHTADNVRGMKPVEGTILTVARDGATAAEAAIKESNELRTVLEQVVDEMHRSVERTPDLLVKNDIYILKEAGVVDAGGIGLAYILEGMLRYMNGDPVEMGSKEVSEFEQLEATIDESGLDFPYDVQFLLKADNLDIDAITTEIEAMGDSALVVGGSDLVKVHVHVVNPGEPLGYAATLGALDDIVVENMRIQYEEMLKQRALEEEVAPPKVREGDIAVIVVSPGAGLKNVFYSLGTAHVIEGGQTMNPSTEDFIAAINRVSTDKLILLPNNSNIFMAAHQAAEHVKNKEVRVVTSRTIPQGINAMLSLDPQGELEVAAQSMSSALDSVRTGEVTTATRSVELDGVNVKEGQFIGIDDSKLQIAGDKLNEVTRDLLASMGATDLELITLYYGDTVNEAEARALVEALSEDFAEQEFEIVNGGQPHYHYILGIE